MSHRIECSHSIDFAVPRWQYGAESLGCGGKMVGMFVL